MVYYPHSLLSLDVNVSVCRCLSLLQDYRVARRVYLCALRFIRSSNSRLSPPIVFCTPDVSPYFTDTLTLRIFEPSRAVFLGMFFCLSVNLNYFARCPTRPVRFYIRCQSNSMRRSPPSSSCHDEIEYEIRNGHPDVFLVFKSGTTSD